MNRRDRSFKALMFSLALSACAAVPLTASAQPYRFVDLTPPGYSITTVGGVGGGQRVGAATRIGGQGGGALLWPDALRPEVVEPSGVFAYATDGQRQVGITGGNDGYRAVLWSGSAASAVDLTPPTMHNAFAAAIEGGRQFGWGVPNTSTLDRAVVWSGTAASFRDITPPQFGYAHALGAGDGQVVGVARVNINVGSEGHPILWSGEALTPTDLLPAGFYEAVAYDADGGRQVGLGYKTATAFDTHALLWSGTAASAVDLHPLAGFRSSVANAIEGDTQVGSGTAGTLERALLWHGSAASVVNLHALLPSKFTESRAGGIDAAGNIYGWAADRNGNGYAVAWLAVPEPGPIAFVLTAAGATLLRRRAGSQPSPGWTAKAITCSGGTGARRSSRPIVYGRKWQAWVVATQIPRVVRGGAGQFHHVAHVRERQVVREDAQPLDQAASRPARRRAAGVARPVRPRSPPRAPCEPRPVRPLRVRPPRLAGPLPGMWALAGAGARGRRPGVADAAAHLPSSLSHVARSRATPVAQRSEAAGFFERQPARDRARLFSSPSPGPRRSTSRSNRPAPAAATSSAPRGLALGPGPRPRARASASAA